MSSEILTALSFLTKPIRDVNSSGAPASQQEALVSALQRNQTELRRMLEGGELQEVRRVREEVRREAPWFCAHTEDPTWSFVQECLLLLAGLARHLTRLLEAFNKEHRSHPPNPRLPDPAPPLPPDVLSVSQQRTFSTVLQFVVTLGLCPYLAPGVGVSLALRSAFGAAVEGAVQCEVAPPSERRLLVTTTVFLEVATVSSLATLVFTRHLGDLMAALCQLGYRPQRPDGGAVSSQKSLTVEERKTCKQELHTLLGRVYQPIVIKELLVLQGGAKSSPSSRLAPAPPWLRRLCGQLLSERLMQPHGVQAVVRAILEESPGGDSDWRKCDAVAKILATCPQQSVSAESYYSSVCPQILDLLHIKDKVTAQQFQGVATRAALTMVQDQPEIAHRFLLTPLLSALRRCAAMPGREDTHVTAEGVVDECELTSCVEDVYKLFVVAHSPSVLLLNSLDDVIPTVFSLFCFTKHNVSHLRKFCQEILLRFLSQVEPSSALSLLKRLCVQHITGVLSGFQFSPGSEGGVRLTQREPVSDEDDALYEKVSGEQWRVECLVQLLAEMKDSDLPGDFFLLLLQELTDLAEEQQEPEDEVDTSCMTLMELEHHLVGRLSGSEQRLALLQALAFMCEGLPHTLLLHKATQVVSFIENMLLRACVALKHGVESAVESQTLSMGMGLVATLLSEAGQLTSEDYSTMTRLLDPLQQISQLHPEPVIQELASDLRATIATRGAYRPDSVSGAASLAHGSKSSTAPPQTKDFSSRVKAATTGSSEHAGDRGGAEIRVNAQQASGDKSSRLKTGGAVTHSSAPDAASGRKAFSELLLEACHPDVPTRAMALRNLTQNIKEANEEALQARDKLLTLFLENLDHEDTFVYLSAIQGLVLLADVFPEQILQKLLSEYQAGPGAAGSDVARPLETRLKVGEALMRASRALGELAPHYGHPLIGAFLRGTRDEDSSIRASSLSNLGELCQRLHFSLGPLAQELAVCLTSLIKTEREAEVRRAAVHVIRLLLRGLADDTTQVLGDVLLQLYRALKWVVHRDSDHTAVVHAQLALEELDEVMRRFIFPQQKLEKKIVVLP